jgi:hypothetical protein
MLDTQKATVEPPYATQLISLVNETLEDEGALYTDTAIGKFSWWIDGSEEFTREFSKMPLIKNGKLTVQASTVKFKLNDFMDTSTMSGTRYGVDINHLRAQREDLATLIKLMKHVGIDFTSKEGDEDLEKVIDTIGEVNFNHRLVQNTGRSADIVKLTQADIGYDPLSILDQAVINLLSNPLYKSTIYHLMKRANVPHLPPKKPDQIAGFVDAYVEMASLFLEVVHGKQGKDVSNNFKVLINKLTENQFFKGTLTRRVVSVVFGKTGGRNV